jgi:hypothetical protein
MTRALSIVSYLILAFGFLYISWHLGRSFERGELNTVLRIPGHEYVSIINEDNEEK